MAKAIAARRYATAVFQIALERDTADQWLEELKALGSVASTSGVAAFMVDPDVRMEKKLQVAREGFANLSPMAQNLAFFLIQRGHFTILPRVYQEYETMLNDHRGIAVAEITTAISMSAEESATIEAHLAQITGKKILMQQKVDPAILGGIVAKLGDRLIDGSLSGKLAALKKQLN